MTSTRQLENEQYLSQHGQELSTFLENLVVLILNEKPKDSCITKEILDKAYNQHHVKSKLVKGITNGNNGTATTIQVKYKPLVIVGPSGVGKGTLIKMLQETFGNQLGFSVSHTTRKPRDGEIHGIHYHFRRRESMEKMISEGAFIEYAKVHDNIYGTSFEGVELVTSSGKVCLLDIDVQGLQAISKTQLQPNAIYIAPPSFEELERRLRGRGTEKEEAIQKRLANAHSEMAYLEHHLSGNKIINDALEDTFIKLKHKIMSWYPHLKEQ
jgi:guanylate kinase